MRKILDKMSLAMRFVHTPMVLLLWVWLTIDLSAQKEDFHWCLGYNGESSQFNPPFGGIDLVFYPDSVLIRYARRSTDFDDCNASICDEHGNLILYTNGIYAGNGSNQVLSNGRGLDEWTDNGNQARQGALILPMPGTRGDTFFILHNFMDIVFLNGQPLGAIFDIFASMADMDHDGGRGLLYNKKELVVSDTIKWGLTAVRHANGRDWWIPIVRHYGDYGYMCLLDPGGISIVDTFYFNDPWPTGSGQVHFSPDGSMYVQAFSENINTGYFLDALDFDRCSGTFSNRRQVVFQDTVFTFGCAVSSNSRYAYVAAFDEIHQYDLWSDDLEGSRIVVAEEDGFETIPGFNRLWFRAMGLGPDGKIYVSGPGTTQHLHTIHAPDSSGKECRVGLHDITLPAYTFSTMPNLPNFRLGPIDGSSCDTLGIDNVPLARYRHTGRGLSKQFLDLSSYEPNEWLWDFGDGNTSVLRQPFHIYQERGIYKVCLTAKNQYGQDSTCRAVWIDTAFTTSVVEEIDRRVRFYPSPSKGEVQLRAPSELYPCNLRVRDIKGRIVHRTAMITDGETSFSFGFLEPGMYLIELVRDNQVIWSDRWIKI